MQGIQRNTGITPSEWRWVIIFSGLLVAITLIPYAWAFASDAPFDNWQFMGILPNPQDGATYLSKMKAGERGDWLFMLQYTPEPHQGAAINEFYLILGHLARITGIQPLLMYHIARLVMGFIMFVSLYYLGSVIWPRLRPRRLFFTVLAVGSGLGYLYLIFFPSQSVTGNPCFECLPTDISMPEMIPFFSTYVNPHFPLAIALIAMLASMFVMVFRPGFNEQPTAGNGGFIVVLLSAGLAVVQPQGLVPIMAGLCVYLLILLIRTRRFPLMETNWVVLVLLPALPFLIYYLAVSRDNEALHIWNMQNNNPSPPVLNYLFGFGLPLLIALPGLWRGIRRFERDGDQFMLVWLIVNAILLYTPFNLQRRLAIGMIIPIVYFAVRALEDFWFHRIKSPLREAALVAVFVFMMPSNIIALLLPVYGVVNPIAGLTGYQLLLANQDNAVDWLNQNGRTGDIVLAPPQVGLWIPATGGLRVVYGHPFETLNAKEKFAEVSDWYAGQNCDDLLQKYRVRYIVSDVITGSSPPTDRCYGKLGPPIASFDGVYIYTVK